MRNPGTLLRDVIARISPIKKKLNRKKQTVTLEHLCLLNLASKGVEIRFFFFFYNPGVCLYFLFKLNSLFMFNSQKSFNLYDYLFQFKTSCQSLQQGFLLWIKIVLIAKEGATYQQSLWCTKLC